MRIVSLLLFLTIFAWPHFVFSQNKDSVQGDREALEALYQATNGSNWDSNSGWNSGNPSNSWRGVEVDGNGRVVELNLRDNNLSGTLPEEIGNLTKLRYFNVKQNDLRGEIPSSIGNMTSLTHLLLNGNESDMKESGGFHPGKPGGRYARARSNQFTGPIPTSIGNMTSLKYIEITGRGSETINDGSGYPGLTGPIPEEIGNLTNLIGLHVGYNSLDYLPESMSNLKNLIHLGIKRNKLAGFGLPEWIGELTNLHNIWIQYNELGGPIPDLSNLNELRLFNAQFNSFEGSFPSFFLDGTMPNINMIELAWNELSGSFPDISGENRLAAFTVDGNNLSGEIPDSWGTDNARRIINFGIAWNNLEGELPDLSHMFQLRYIRARDNNFSGRIPRLHRNNSSLRNLYYRNNNFSGYVDPSIAEAIANGHPDFGAFDLRDNNFCDDDLADIISAVNGLSKSVNFSYGSQDCGGGNSGNDPGDGDDSDDGDSGSGGGGSSVVAPEILTPEDGEDGKSLTPTFSWSDEQADYYILFANRMDPQDEVLDDIEIEGTSFTPEEPLEPDTEYHWRVKAVKDGEESEWSEVFAFFTGDGESDNSDDGDDGDSGDGNNGDDNDTGGSGGSGGDDGDSDDGDDSSDGDDDNPTGGNPDDEETTPPAPDPAGPVTGGADPVSRTPTFAWSELEVDRYELIVETAETRDIVIHEEVEETSYSPQEALEAETAYEWRVRGVNGESTGAWSEPVRFVTEAPGETLETSLEQNYPNPFNPTTRIEFSVDQTQQVSLRVYDVSGRLVATLVDEMVSAGTHQATFRADGLASGVYFYRLVTETQVLTSQMTHVK